jgi:hypothetical protein
MMFLGFAGLASWLIVGSLGRHIRPPDQRSLDRIESRLRAAFLSAVGQQSRELKANDHVLLLRIK